MKQRSAISLLVVVMILSLSLSRSLNSESEKGDSMKLGLTLPHAYGVLPRIASGSIVGQILNSSTRLMIYDYVLRNPGVHFRGICGGLGLSVGVVQYHLERLTGQGILTSRKDRRYKRYFETMKYSEDELKVISTLRKETARMTISILLETPRMTHRELTASLGISSQGLTWLIGRLKEEGVLEIEKTCRSVRYSIKAEYRETCVNYLRIIV